jgi:hypothetical protein
MKAAAIHQALPSIPPMFNQLNRYQQKSTPTLSADRQ